MRKKDLKIQEYEQEIEKFVETQSGLILEEKEREAREKEHHLFY